MFHWLGSFWNTNFWFFEIPQKLLLQKLGYGRAPTSQPCRNGRAPMSRRPPVRLPAFFEASLLKQLKNEISPVNTRNSPVDKKNCWTVVFSLMFLQMYWCWQSQKSVYLILHRNHDNSKMFICMNNLGMRAPEVRAHTKSEPMSSWPVKCVLTPITNTWHILNFETVMASSWWSTTST